MIEGDNLQVMVSLRSQYTGAVDVVYIDPPYNRGGNDFRYSDSRFHDPNADGNDAAYVSNEDGGRHTKWLNFMAPRLALIWELLSDRGVVFVSINDIELFRLGMLLDEIFDERNRVGVICWKGAADNNPTRIAVEHEYILCYAKRLSEVRQVWQSPNDDLKETLMDEFAHLRKETRSLSELKKRWAAFYLENRGSFGRLGAYRELDEEMRPYQSARRVHNPKPGGYRYDVIHPETGKPCRQPLNGYRYPEDRMKELLKDGLQESRTSMLHATRIVVRRGAEQHGHAQVSKGRLTLTGAAYAGYAQRGADKKADLARTSLQAGYGRSQRVGLVVGLSNHELGRRFGHI